MLAEVTGLVIISRRVMMMMLLQTPEFISAQMPGPALLLLPWQGRADTPPTAGKREGRSGGWQCVANTESVHWVCVASSGQCTKSSGPSEIERETQTVTVKYP